jgi:hypothetical protein
MFQGFTRIAPAPRDWAAPANYKNTKSLLFLRLGDYNP